MKISLKELRNKNNITCEEFAQSIGVSPSAVRMYESGHRIPRYGTMEKISLYFSIPMGDIFFGKQSHETR